MDRGWSDLCGLSTTQVSRLEELARCPPLVSPDWVVGFRVKGLDKDDPFNHPKAYSMGFRGLEV